MKVALLTPRFPYPPDRGDRLAAYYLIRELGREHRITLFTCINGSEPPEAMAEMSRSCERIETVRLSRWRSWLQAWLGLFSSLPSQVAYYRSAGMRRRVREIINAGRFDVVFAHTIRLVPSVNRLRHPLKILSLGDSLGMALRRSMEYEPRWKWPGIAWESRRVNRYTAAISHRARETWVLSPVNQADMIRLGCRDVVLMPHGVDDRLFDVEHEPGPEPTVVSLGNLSVPHNVDAAHFLVREIWPAVLRERPASRLVLAGADPLPAVRRLAEPGRIEVPGAIPDLRTLWRRADVMIAPLRFSTGVQNKVLEAMAAGVPVVTTPQVAEGIEARHGQHLLVASDAAGLAAALLESLRDPASASRRAERARAYVREHFSWMTLVRRLEHLAAAPEGAGAAARA